MSFAARVIPLAASLSTTTHSAIETGDSAQMPIAETAPRMATWRHDTKASLHRSDDSVNRRLAVLVAVILCLLFVFAVFGIVLHGSRRRRSSRRGIGSRPESVSEQYRDDFDAEDQADLAPANHDDSQRAVGDEQHPAASRKRSDDALSMITEMPTNSVNSEGGTDLDTRHEPRLPSSISSRSQTLNAVGNLSDDDDDDDDDDDVLHGHLSGLDEDPFVDRVAILRAVPNQQLSEPVSPLSPPSQHKPKLDTSAVSARSNISAASDSSQAPITAIKTARRHDESIDNAEHEVSPHLKEQQQQQPQQQQQQDGGVAALEPQHGSAERGRGRVRSSDATNTARSSSVSTRQSRLRAADIARSPDPRCDIRDHNHSSRSPQAASIDEYIEAASGVRSRGSNYHHPPPPPPPLVDRSSWLGQEIHGRQREELSNSTTSPMMEREVSSTDGEEEDAQ